MDQTCQKRAELAAFAYCKGITTRRNAPDVIHKLCGDYVGYLYPNPNQDAANFITPQDRKRALYIKEAGNNQR